jgi:hypothetical protein
VLQSKLEKTYVFLDNNLLELSGLGQLVLGQRLAAEEDVEHQCNALEAQQVISAVGLSPRSFVLRGWCSGIPVGRDLNLELRGLLHPVDDRAVLVCGLRGLSGDSYMSMGG